MIALMHSACTRLRAPWRFSLTCAFPTTERSGMLAAMPGQSSFGNILRLSLSIALTALGCADAASQEKKAEGNAVDRTATKAAKATERTAKRAVGAVEHGAKAADKALTNAAEKTDHWVKQKTK